MRDKPSAFALWASADRLLFSAAGKACLRDNPFLATAQDKMEFYANDHKTVAETRESQLR